MINKKVIGKMKNETKVIPIVEFAGFARSMSKMYSVMKIIKIIETKRQKKLAKKLAKKMNHE